MELIKCNTVCGEGGGWEEKKRCFYHTNVIGGGIHTRIDGMPIRRVELALTEDGQLGHGSVLRKEEVGTQNGGGTFKSGQINSPLLWSWGSIAQSKGFHGTRAQLDKEQSPSSRRSSTQSVLRIQRAHVCRFN